VAILLTLRLHLIGRPISQRAEAAALP